jgi:hypothetical protein
LERVGEGGQLEYSRDLGHSIGLQRCSAAGYSVTNVQPGYRL